MSRAETATSWQPLEEIVPSEVFRSEVVTWARRIGVEPREIHVKPLKRKWASCSSRGRLTFDVSLLRQPAPFRAQVIVHELLHLKVPNHGKVFQALLKAHLPFHSKDQPLEMAGIWSNLRVGWQPQAR